MLLTDFSCGAFMSASAITAVCASPILLPCKLPHPHRPARSERAVRREERAGKSARDRARGEEREGEGARDRART